MKEQTNPIPRTLRPKWKCPRWLVVVIVSIAGVNLGPIAYLAGELAYNEYKRHSLLNGPLPLRLRFVDTGDAVYLCYSNSIDVLPDDSSIGMVGFGARNLLVQSFAPAGDESWFIIGNDAIMPMKIDAGEPSRRAAWEKLGEDWASVEWLQVN